MAGLIQQRRGTAAEATAANPILANGQLGVETDTGRIKVGNGVDRWNVLPYSDNSPSGGLAGHLADTVDAHDASAISFTPAADISATDVQAAIVEVSNEHIANSLLTTDGDLVTRIGGVPARITRADVAADPAFSGRFTPATFFVDWYLPAGVTPATATSAQTLAAYTAARDAAFAVGGTVKFTPGRTYQIDDVFIIKSAMTFDCSGAILRKRSTTGYQTPLIVNEDWAAGNPDITVIAEGATWDHNGRALLGGSGRPYGGLGDCVHFQNCDRLTMIGRPLIKDASKFALTIGHADDIHVDGARFDTRSDGCHVYGPMRRGYFGTFSGTTGDDFFSFTISDYPDQVANLVANGETVTAGDFEDITIEALHLRNDVLPTGGAAFGSGLAMLGGSASFRFDRIHVKSILGRSKQAVRLTNDLILTQTHIGTVTIDEVQVNRGAAASQISLNPTTAQTITFGNITNTDTGGTIVVDVRGSGVTQTLNIDSITHVAGLTGSVVNIAESATVQTLNVGKANVALGTGGRFVQHDSTVTSRINVSNFDIRGLSGQQGWGCWADPGSAGATWRFQNGSLRSLTKALPFASGTNIVMLDNVSVDGCLTYVEVNNCTVRLLYGVVRQTAGGDESITKVGGAPLFSCNGAMGRVDHTRIDTSVAVRGDIINNIVAGSLGLGLAQWNGTAWVLV